MEKVSAIFTSNNKFNRVTVVLLLILGIIISFLLYISNKGFEFSDEGLYALLSNPKQENSFRAINYDILYKYLYQFFNITFDIQELRLIRILLNLFGSIILFLGFKTFNDRLEIKKFENLNFLIFIIICGFCNYLFGNVQTPGYNAFHFLDLQLIAGSLLAICYKENSSILHSLGYSFLLSTGLLLCWLTKPTGIPLLFLLIIVCLVVNRDNYRSQTILILFGFFLLYIFLIHEFSNFSDRIAFTTYSNIFSTVNQQMNTHSMDLLFKRAGVDFVIFILSIIIGFITFKVSKTRHKYLLYFLSLLFLAVILIDINRSYLKFPNTAPFYQLYTKSRIFVLIFLSIAVFLGYFFSSIPKHKKKNALFLVFISLLLTVCYVFGSNNNNFSLAITCIQFLVIPLWVYIPRVYEDKFFQISALLIVLALLISYSFNSNSQKYVTDLKYKYKYGKDLESVIFLDYSSYSDQKKIDSILREYDTPYIVAYTRMPGNIYLAGKTSPGSFLWGEEDLGIYFQFRFNKPQNFILLLENNKKEVLKYLRDYDTSFIKILNLNSRPKDMKNIYVYSCEKKITTF